MQEAALAHFKGFIKILDSLVVDNKINIDLTIGPGDTGFAMAKLASIVFDEKNSPVPKILAIPYYRFKQKNFSEGETFVGNNLLIPYIQNELNKVNKLDNMLFVDDEIGQARTLKGILALLYQARPDLFHNRPNIYVVADDKGFDDNNVPQFVNVHYCPFANGATANNVIVRIVPKELDDPIKSIYTDSEYSFKERMNALLNLPIKELNQGRPEWSYDFLNELNTKIRNFPQLQNSFDQYLRDIVRGDQDKNRVGLSTSFKKTTLAVISPLVISGLVLNRLSLAYEQDLFCQKNFLSLLTCGAASGESPIQFNTYPSTFSGTASGSNVAHVPTPNLSLDDIFSASANRFQLSGDMEYRA